MATENTSLKNTTPAGDSNTTNEMVIGKSNTYQRTFLIVAGSLLALLVLIAVAGTSGGHRFNSSTHEITEGVGALADYQVDTTTLALTKDIFGLGAFEGCGIAPFWCTCGCCTGIVSCPSLIGCREC